jgi:hypothetical protein
MFEQRVLSRIFRAESDEITGKWRRLHSEVLTDLYRSPNIVRVIKSRRMRCSACGGEERCIKGFGG